MYSDPRAYVSLFFMFLSLVTGCVYFTFAVTGLSLSLGLAILIIGLPVFLGFIGITRVISLAEGRLLEAVSGERMPRRPVHPGAPDGLVARILEMLKDARTWTTLIYLLMMLPLGIVYFVTAVTGLAVGVSFVLVPVVGIAQRLGWWVPWENDGRDRVHSGMDRHARGLGVRRRVRRRRPDDAAACGARRGQRPRAHRQDAPGGARRVTSSGQVARGSCGTRGLLYR